VDSFRESMDSFRFDSSVFKRFNSWIRFVTQFSKDLFRGFVSWPSFQKIRFVDSFRDTIFQRFDESNESHESLRILSTIGQTNPSESFGFGFANPLDSDSRILWFSKDSFRGFVSWHNFQKIRFVDSFRDTTFKRFVSWIRFVRSKIPNYSIRFVS
jgi:hypothetical protein